MLAFSTPFLDLPFKPKERAYILIFIDHGKFF